MAGRVPLGAQRGRPAQQESKKYAKVLYNYTAAYEDELSLRHNDVVVIVSTNSSAGSGWAEARLRGKIGKIPDNYIEFIEEPKGLVLVTKIPRSSFAFDTTHFQTNF